MSRSNRGNVLAQYGIVIALVSIAIIPVFFLFGKTIVSQFTAFYNGLSADYTETSDANTGNTGGNSGNTGNNGNTGNTGGGNNQTGPSQQNPVVSCSGSSCEIDFGDYVLEGIPGDFKNYVNSTGSSGGTESLMTVLDEIIANADLPDDQKNLLQELSNAGHNLSDMQERIELSVNHIYGTEDYSTWARDEYRSIENYTTFETKLTAALQSLNNPGNMHDENIKAIVQLLGAEVIQMNSNLVQKCTDINTVISDLRQGKSTSENLQDMAYNLVHPAASETTDIDSAIICETGSGNDTGDQCN